MCKIHFFLGCSQLHLTEEEFNKVFGMSIHDYRPLPQWKKNNLKKSVDLF